MASHKFQVGETVLLTSRNRNVPGGVYEITKLLPHNGSEFDTRLPPLSPGQIAFLCDALMLFGCTLDAILCENQRLRPERDGSI